LATTTNAKATLHQRAIHELKERDPCRLSLHYPRRGRPDEDRGAAFRGIEFAPWGIAVVTAAVLAKFMLLGNAMRIGGRNTTSPLIRPTLRNAFAFLVLLIIMTIIEEAVVGLFHHRSIATSLSELAGPRLEETIAGFVIMLLVLIPFFRFPRPQRSAWRRQVGADVLCRAGTDGAAVREARRASRLWTCGGFRSAGRPAFEFDRYCRPQSIRNPANATAHA
jgi:hypothetical protein